MWKPWLLDYFIKWVNITELSCTYFFHLRRATVPETVGRLDFSRELVSSESRLPRMYIEKAVRIPHSVPSVCFISMPKLISRTAPNLFRKCFCDACLARKDKLTLFLFQFVKTFTRVVNNISPSYFAEKMDISHYMCEVFLLACTTLSFFFCYNCYKLFSLCNKKFL